MFDNEIIRELVKFSIGYGSNDMILRKRCAIDLAEKKHHQNSKKFNRFIKGYSLRE